MKKAHLIIAVTMGGGVAGMRLNIISPKKYLSVQRKCIINLTTWVGHTATHSEHSIGYARDSHSTAMPLEWSHRPS